MALIIDSAAGPGRRGVGGYTRASFFSSLPRHSTMRIGAIELPNSLFVAPMAGVTDRPFRQLCRTLGAGYAVSEMVTSRRDLWNTLKTSRRANHDGEPGPIAVQIAGTDAAMMSAMAHVMLSEGLYDADFVRTHCLGFDASQMPPGYEEAENFSDYILGRRDHTPKTPEWAEPITAVPAETIRRIARQYATLKPGVLYQGTGMQRRAYGEQVVRAGCVLAAITGNVGVPGGWASGLGLQAPDGGAIWNVFPPGPNPVGASIPVFLWTEAVLRGKELGHQHGVTGHNSGWIDGPFLSVADDRRARAGEQGDTVKLALGANFLEDT